MTVRLHAPGPTTRHPGETARNAVGSLIEICWLKEAYRGPQVTGLCVNIDGYGFTELGISNSTISTVFHHSLLIASVFWGKIGVAYYHNHIPFPPYSLLTMYRCTRLYVCKTASATLDLILPLREPRVKLLFQPQLSSVTPHKPVN